VRRSAGAANVEAQTPRVPAAAVRSRLYALLAEALGFPQPAMLERLRSGALQAEFDSTAAQLAVPLVVPTLDTGVANLADAAMAQTYTRLFHACGTRPAVSMLERHYRARGEAPQPLWEALLRFYRHFGLDFSHAGLRESPDHLLVEIEFMHYLCYLEAGAVAATADLRRGQRDFLRAHLASWIGQFAEALAREAADGPYAVSARLLTAFVAADLHQLEHEDDDL